MANLPPPLPTIPPPPVTPVKGPAGNVIGTLPISDQDKAQLAANGNITMSFHTPRMLRETLGPRNFTLTLVQDAQGNITADPGQLAKAVSHLTEIANALALGVKLTTGGE